MGATHVRRLGRLRPTSVVVGVLVAALVASLVDLGEPSRPATATIVRPIVTVPALCSAPTVVDVAARDATRGLTAVGQLLGVEDALVADAARDLRVVDTDAGTFFVLARDDELRVAALSPAGLPIVDASADAPRTFRAFSLGAELEGRAPLVVGGPHGIFVVLGGDDAPVRVLALTPTTLASDVEVSSSRDVDGPVLADPLARPGAAVVHDGVLWLAGDDGRVITFDPLADRDERWTPRDAGLLGSALAAGEGGVVGLFPVPADDGAAAADGQVEVRTFPVEGDPRIAPVDGAVREVAAAAFPGSSVPAFVVTTDAGPALLRPAAARGDTVAAVPIAPLAGRPVGVLATGEAAAIATTDAGALRYTVLDAAGAEAGTFAATDAERCTDGAFPDAAALVRPTSAGTLLHLHDPGAPRDCVVDGRDPVALADVTAACGPAGEWSVDKGSAPARDFTVEIGRAFDELAADRSEQDAAAAEGEPAAADAIQEELSTAGLDVVETEVDPAAADECAAEEVTGLAPPVLDLAEPVGSRAIRLEWTWSGGACLPGRYLVAVCLLAAEGSACADTTETEVVADRTTARSSLELPAEPDRTYRVAVRAVKESVRSEPSGALLVTTPAATPDPPTAARAVLRDGRWDVRWSSCLSAGGCTQRPDGFVVTVEGCEGDGLGQVRRRVDAAERGVRFGADGGELGADLLGRRIRVAVASTSGERTSEPVVASGCVASVRPGREATAASLGVTLTGRSRQVTLAPIAGGRRLTELFGTASYDDVAARLRRGSFTSGTRTGVRAGAVTFDVDRCAGSGWTLELTPRRGGQDLPVHRARLTDARVACDPSIDGDTRVSTRVRGVSADGIGVTVTVPELGQDAANGLVAGVTGQATCASAFGGDRTVPLAGGRTDGDDVAFTMPVPVVFDLARACEVAVVVAFTGGGSAAPAPRRVDLSPAAAAVVEAVAPAAAAQLERARTATYDRRRTGLIGLEGNEPVVAVRHDGSGVPCHRSYGTSTWRFEVVGTDHAACDDGAHAIAYAERHLDDRGVGPFELRVSVAGADRATTSVSRPLPVCQLPGGSPRPPCGPEPEPCPTDPELPADDPACEPEVVPCPSDPDLPADDPACGAEADPCPTDPELPVDDPACQPPGEPPPARRRPAGPTDHEAAP